jgi:SUR7/PalI family
MKSTYFLQVNITDVANFHSSILNGLETDAEHDIGIHDFYRYGLWGYCDGYNDTVTFCSKPKPGNSTNPISVINSEITKKLSIPLPSDVEKKVNDLTSVSLVLFSFWIVGVLLSFFAAIFILFMFRWAKIVSFLVGLLAFVGSLDIVLI